MKRLKLFGIVGAAVIALGGCDAMLKAMFPEFGDQGGFEKSITLNVSIPANYRGGAGTVGNVRAVIVEWSYDQFGLFFWRTADGKLDRNGQPVIDPDPGTNLPATSVGVTATFTFSALPPSNYAVIVYDDEDADSRLSTGDTARVATWSAPADFPWTNVEFDLIYLSDDEPGIDSDVTSLVHKSQGGTPFQNLPY